MTLISLTVHMDAHHSVRVARWKTAHGVLHRQNAVGQDWLGWPWTQTCDLVAVCVADSVSRVTRRKVSMCAQEIHGCLQPACLSSGSDRRQSCLGLPSPQHPQPRPCQQPHHRAKRGHSGQKVQAGSCSTWPSDTRIPRSWRKCSPDSGKQWAFLGHPQARPGPESALRF